MSAQSQIYAVLWRDCHYLITLWSPEYASEEQTQALGLLPAIMVSIQFNASLRLIAKPLPHPGNNTLEQVGAAGKGVKVGGGWG